MLVKKLRAAEVLHAGNGASGPHESFPKVQVTILTTIGDIEGSDENSADGGSIAPMVCHVN